YGGVEGIGVQEVDTPPALMSFSIWLAATTSPQISKRSRHAAGWFVSAPRRARNRRSTSDYSCENGRRSSARCCAGARSKKKPKPRGSLHLPFCHSCQEARFVQS